MTVRPLVWVGIDVGKTSHHACAVDETGKVLWNQKVSNEQRAIEQLIARAHKGADEARWAIDLGQPDGVDADHSPAWCRAVGGLCARARGQHHDGRVSRRG